MAVQVWYPANLIITAANLNSLTLGSPASVHVIQGWRPGTNTAPNYKPFIPEDVTGGTYVTDEPTAFSAKGYRIEFVQSGLFADSNWVFDFKVTNDNTTTYAAEGQVGMRLWRSVNANGSGATQVTDGWKYSGTLTWTGLGQTQTGQTVWTPGATKTLTAEYLFIELLWKVVTAGGSTSEYRYFREESTTTLTTPDFTPAAGGGGLTLPKRYGLAGVI